MYEKFLDTYHVCVLILFFITLKPVYNGQLFWTGLTVIGLKNYLE